MSHVSSLEAAVSWSPNPRLGSHRNRRQRLGCTSSAFMLVVAWYDIMDSGQDLRN